LENDQPVVHGAELGADQLGIVAATLIDMVEKRGREGIIKVPIKRGGAMFDLVFYYVRGHSKKEK
jgi:hypothetical protein